MSWQGNECFVFVIEYGHKDMEGMMLDAMDELLWLYMEHGNGWYLLGNWDSGEDEDDYYPFKLMDDGKWGYGWLPNPFMDSAVSAINVRNPHDLLGVAFECYDSRFDVIAYAGDGDEPLEHVVIYGKEYDLRN